MFRWLHLKSSRETGDSETAASTGPTVMDTADESGQSSKYLERSVLDTVTEGVTEGIIDVVSLEEKLKFVLCVASFFN